MTSHLILLLISTVCTITGRDWRTLALTMLVGANVNVPIPDQHFYFWCAVAELAVIAGALLARCPATRPIAAVSAALIMCHYLGWRYDGYPPTSPYYILVTIAEHAELVACIIFSKLFLGRPKS